MELGGINQKNLKLNNDMEVVELNEQSDVIDVKPETSEELTEEQIKEQEEVFLKWCIRRNNKSILRALKYRMAQGITLEEILQEIEEKRSPLSANQRLFVQSFKLDFIKELLEV